MTGFQNLPRPLGNVLTAGEVGRQALPCSGSAETFGAGPFLCIQGTLGLPSELLTRVFTWQDTSRKREQECWYSVTVLGKAGGAIPLLGGFISSEQLCQDPLQENLHLEVLWGPRVQDSPLTLSFLFPGTEQERQEVFHKRMNKPLHRQNNEPGHAHSEKITHC